MSDLHFESVEKNIASANDVTNPKYIGPGTWNVIHTLAYNATTPKSKQAFMDHMIIICHQFPCDTCRGHCKQYLKENPMTDYLDVVTEGKALGLFTWTWQFHNAVNFRIGKPLMSWDMAVHIYTQFKNETHDGQCSKDCSDPDHQKPKAESIRPSTAARSSAIRKDIKPIQPRMDNGKPVQNRIDNVKPHKPLFKLEKEKRYYAEHQTTLNKPPIKLNKKVKNYNELY